MPVSFGKRSGAALEGAPREQGRSKREQRGSSEEAGGSNKGAGGSIEGAKREQGEQQGGIIGQYRGVVGGSLKLLLPSRLELPSLLFLLPRLRYFL